MRLTNEENSSRGSGLEFFDPSDPDLGSITEFLSKYEIIERNGEGEMIYGVIHPKFTLEHISNLKAKLTQIL